MFGFDLTAWKELQSWLVTLAPYAWAYALGVASASALWFQRARTIRRRALSAHIDRICHHR